MSTGAMINSGIEWIGDVPAHWEFKRLKYTSTLAGRIGWQGLTSEEYRTEGVHLVTGTDFKEGRINWDSCVRVSEARWAEATQVQLQEGDLLITKDGTVGKVAICRNMPNKASLNSGVMVIRQKASISNRFLYWVLESPVFRGWFSDVNAGASTISHLYQADFYNFGFYIPPTVREQEQVAAVLDVETSKIDRALNLLEQELETLEQLKKSLIYEAVTKGLDPTVPMRSSGVDWIGDIPEHWSITRLSTKVTKVGSGKTPLGGADTYVDEGIPLIRSQNIFDGELHLDDAVRIDASTELGMHSTRVRSGDVLLNITGASIGRSCVVPGGVGVANVNQHVCIIRPDQSQILPLFLHYLWSTVGQEWVFQNQNGATREALTFQEIRSAIFPVPDLPTQQHIVTQVQEQLAKLNLIQSSKEEQLRILNQQRASLIFEYVTGKRRVSEVA